MARKVSGTSKMLSKITPVSEAALDRKLFDAKGSMNIIGTRQVKSRGMKQFFIKPPGLGTTNTPNPFGG